MNGQTSLHIHNLCVASAYAHCNPQYMGMHYHAELAKQLVSSMTQASHSCLAGARASIAHSLVKSKLAYHKQYVYTKLLIRLACLQKE